MNSKTPIFSQGLDSSRPHTLLTENVQHSGTLVYRYDDTQEQVRVPNIHYNQTFQVRVAAIRWQARLKDEQAEHFEKHPQPFDLSPAAVAAVVRRLQETAIRMRQEADRMEAAGDPLRPVEASKMKLDFGITQD